ncbi:MerR family transcriptional regulator, partial [Streptomyces sp. NPDC059525]
ALAGIPGGTAAGALADLSRDEDRSVSRTAAYLLRSRGA